MELHVRAFVEQFRVVCGQFQRPLQSDHICNHEISGIHFDLCIVLLGGWSDLDA